MPDNSCLSADQLKSYALGRLDDLQTELVSQHLQDCQNCEETLSGFDDTNDSLLLQIRKAQPPAEDSPAPLEAALAGIAALHTDGLGTPTQVPGTSSASTQPQAADDWVRDYRLVGKLGQGGMGTVYKAVHERLQRTVAIKLLPARRLRNREAIERFEREMQAIGRLDHPAIVRATDAGEVEGTHFLAMDYVNGIDLGKVVRLTGPLSIPNACEVIRVVATGLSYAHEQGLIHRDVKPSNIMLALPDSGGEANVKLLDLGLALFGAASEAVDAFTTVGQLMGTLDYMAPEQADHSHVGATADVYSLGATLFKLLTGRAPFETREFQSPLQKMKALATLTAPSLHDRRPETPPSLVVIADQLLQRDPADRMSSAAEVSEAMQPFCEGHNLKQLAEQAIQQQALEDARLETENLPTAQPSIPSAMLKSVELENGEKPAVASGSGTNNNRWKRWLAASAAAPLLAFLGAIIWIQTDRGTLKIESVADDVPIEIRQGKQLVESFTLKSGPNEISLRSGRHEVMIAANYDQLQVSNNKVEIQRGGEAIVRVEHVAEGGRSLFRSSGPSQGKSASPKKNPDPLGSVAVFEGKTYAEWKSLLNRERSPAELIKGIDALAALSEEANAAETCEAILKIMDGFQAVPQKYSIESQVVKTGVRRIRELDPETVEPVLRAALGTISANIDTVILGELCNYTTLLYGAEPPPGNFGGANATGASGPIEPLRTVLFQSEEFTEAAFRSWPNWGSGDVRTSFSDSAVGVLYQMISARREGQKPLTPAMLNFCRAMVEQGMNPENAIPSYSWQSAVFVLLETTQQEDLPDVLWKRMTFQDDENRWNAWRMLAESPIAIRRMLPLLKANIGRSAKSVLTALIYQRPGDGPYLGFLDRSQQPHFYCSTLIVELMGLAGKDAISCRQLLSDQFMLHTGAIPKSDGVHTYRAAEDRICTRLNNLEPAEGDTEDAEAKATLRHVQALLWTWEQITGEPPRFTEPRFPKLAEFPRSLQPEIEKYNGKTLAEWAEFDGSDFESWEAEMARFTFLNALRTEDGLPEPVQEARKRIAEHAVLEFHDDPAWYELVRQLINEKEVGQQAEERFTRMLTNLNTPQCATLFTECFIQLSDAVSTDEMATEGLSTRLASLAFPYLPGTLGKIPASGPTAVINRLVLALHELPLSEQREVLIRLSLSPFPLSLDAQTAIKRMSDTDGELQVVATFAAARQWQLSKADCEQIIDRLIEILEQPNDNNADWVNASISLSAAAKNGLTVQQRQRLMKIIGNEGAAELFDVLWNHAEPVYADGAVQMGPPISVKRWTKTIVVSRQSLVWRVLEELYRLPGPEAVSMLTSEPNVPPIVGLAELNGGLNPRIASMIHSAYVQSVRPCTSTAE